MYNQGYSNQGYTPSAPSSYPGAYPPEPPRYPTYPPPGGATYQGAHPQQGYPGAYPQPKPACPEAMSSPAYGFPAEDPQGAFDFSDQSIRRSFIRKVYSILTSQLLITVAFVAVFLFEKRVQRYFEHNYYYYLIAIAVTFVLVIVLSCCDGVRRQAPWNFILLFIFTLVFSFMVASAAATYRAQEVMLAIGLTAAITLGLTLFAFQTKIDFTKWGGALFVLLLVVIFCSIFYFFFPSRVFQIIIAGVGAIVMSLYILYDTQLMMGGKHKYSISPEEYIFASLNLYLDIVNLFMYILQLIGGRD